MSSGFYISLSPLPNALSSILGHTGLLGHLTPRFSHRSPVEDFKSFVEMIELAAKITGISAPRAVTPRIFGALAPVVSVAERAVSTPQGFESEFLRRMNGTTWFGDTSKAEKEPGIEHRPIEEGLREYLEWEMNQLGIRVEPQEVPSA